MRTLNRLSTLKVSGLKGKGMYADGGGLYLRVGESGTKGWIFRFGENGKLHDMGLGPLHTISLAEARELATECRKLRLQGIDPIAHRRASLAARKASAAPRSWIHFRGSSAPISGGIFFLPDAMTMR